MNIEKIEAKFFSREYIKEKVDWMNDQRVNSTMYFELPATFEKTEEWFENNIGNKKRVDFCFVEDCVTIGMGGLTSIDLKNGNAEFYIMINPSLQGRGFGKKTSQWLFNYAFLKYNLNKIYLYTDEFNKKAYKIYENCGFVLEGVLRKHKNKKGLLVNRRIYGMLEDEWRMQPWSNNKINFTIR